MIPSANTSDVKCSVNLLKADKLLTMIGFILLISHQLRTYLVAIFTKLYLVLDRRVDEHQMICSTAATKQFRVSA